MMSKVSTTSSQTIVLFEKRVHSAVVQYYPMDASDPSKNSENRTYSMMAMRKLNVINLPSLLPKYKDNLSKRATYKSNSNNTIIATSRTSRCLDTIYILLLFAIVVLDSNEARSILE